MHQRHTMAVRNAATSDRSSCPPPSDLASTFPHQATCT
ncbi:hypothetical protein M3J09_002525 [Ascochyta lentis]